VGAGVPVVRSDSTSAGAGAWLWAGP